jgi:hypothetical protein
MVCFILWHVRVNSGVVNFIQACPPALSEVGNSPRAGYFECVGPAAFDRKLSLSFCIAMIVLWLPDLIEDF